MRITCIKFGGFMGKSEICEIDINELDQEEIKALNAIRNSTSDVNTNLNDGFTYAIEFEDDELIEKVTLDQSTITKDMVKLIQKIEDTLQ